MQSNKSLITYKITCKFAFKGNTAIIILKFLLKWLDQKLYLIFLYLKEYSNLICHFKLFALSFEIFMIQKKIKVFLKKI